MSATLTARVHPHAQLVGCRVALTRTGDHPTRIVGVLERVSVPAVDRAHARGVWAWTIRPDGAAHPEHVGVWPRDLHTVSVVTL